MLLETFFDHQVFADGEMADDYAKSVTLDWSGRPHIRTSERQYSAMSDSGPYNSSPSFLVTSSPVPLASFSATNTEKKVKKEIIQKSMFQFMPKWTESKWARTSLSPQVHFPVFAVSIRARLVPVADRR